MGQKFYVSVLVVLLIVRDGLACSGVGSNQIITNPTMTLKFYPPTGWTYPNSGAETSVSYFPGQSMTLSQANLLATGDMTSATLNALNDMGFITTDVTITPTYTPPNVNDCGKSTDNSATATPAGVQFGVEENGAITKLASASAQITVQNCIIRAFAGSGTVITYTDFPQSATLKIDNLVASEYQMNLVASKIMSILMLNNRVQFIEEILVQ
uniref:DUF4377 domain-containing protein n=1 Tax=Panagrellus redivivus TaxID=6233 RepID=A0A7E4VYG7_PANRE